MTRNPRGGGAYVEFALSLPILLGLMLGVIGLGLNMLLQMQTVQLARDAGHMFARNIDFTLQGNQQLLSAIAGTLGLSNGSGSAGLTGSGAGTAVVILSEVKYVDSSVCSGCTNLGYWVFTNRIVVGNSALRTSNVGTPPYTGVIAAADQTGTSSDRATIPTGANGFTPWNGANGSGLPSGQWIFVVEASARGFHMPPFSSGTNTYSQLYF